MGVHYIDPIGYYLDSKDPFVYGPAKSVIQINRRVRRMVSMPVIQAIEIHRFKKSNFK